MILRVISVISLIQFVLLMISGVSINVALYRSIFVFMILFTLVYLVMFFLNIIKDDPNAEQATSGGESNSSSNPQQNYAE